MRRSDPERQPEMPDAARRIYTVPHGTPFLTALARALLAGDLPTPGGPKRGPLELAGVTLLLPTRRDIRALQDAFLQVAGGKALLLPRIRLISHDADDLSAFMEAADPDDLGGEGKPAIGKTERELTLTRLVLQWSEAARRAEGGTGGRTPAQAVRQAKDLARLMDLVEMEEVDLSGLDALVREDFAAHWGQTLDFLKIVTDIWPRHLAEQGKASRAARRKQLMLAEAERLRRQPPAGPVIVAGVTGTVPAATELMRAVLELENGALVLPTLDRMLDEQSWNQITPKHPEHPQFGLKTLLDALGVEREHIGLLPGCASSPAQHARWRLVSQAMRPAATTEQWHAFLDAAGKNAKNEMARAMAGWTVLDAPSAGDEAEAAALILREAIEHPHRTAMLVTPDRSLARRVSARLETWGLDVPDLAGQPLATTPPGAFLDLVIEAAARRFAPVPLMMLLKHPLCRLGLTPQVVATGREVLELAVFRAPYLGNKLEDIGTALERAASGTLPGAHRGRAVRRIGDRKLDAARSVLRRLSEIARPLEELFSAAGPVGLQTLAAAHLDAAERLAEAGKGADPGILWQGSAGEELNRLLRDLIDPEQPFAPSMAPGDYPEFYRALAGDRTVAPAGPLHPRLAICGPLEARLQQPDIVILGSLNEGTWPKAADPGPWFNRGMREALGLPAPEQKIGEAAHDFTSLLGAERVYLTRAAKIDGAPTVPSRWLLRLQVLMKAARATGAAVPEGVEPWLAWAGQRNRAPGPARPVPAPEPRPALPLRPRRLSVTDIEKWIANPYAIFAARILRLEPLPPLGRRPDAALRGQIVHDALSRFARKFPDTLPDDPAAELRLCAQAALADLTGSPRVAAFWAPRLDRFAAWFAETEPERRRDVLESFAELDGELVLDAPGGPFTLRARADRIDIGRDGLIVTDYKTAANLDPLVRNAKASRAPQLLLEAAMAAAGAFAQIPAGPVKALRYISAAGGKPPGIEKDLDLGPAEVAEIALRTRDNLIRLIAEFDRPQTPYRALRRPGFNYKYDDFAHLARVSEWSIEIDDEEAA